MMNRSLIAIAPLAIALCVLLPQAARAADPPAAVAPVVKPLPPEDEVALRCGVIFALGAKAQERGAPGSAGWTGLATRGREFFARAGAKAMDDTGMTRDQLRSASIGMAIALTGELSGAPDTDKALAAKVDACLPLLGVTPTAQ